MHIRFFILLLMSLLWSFGMLAQSVLQDSTAEVLKDILVSVSRVAMPLDASSRSVHVITAEEIAAAPVQSIGDVLEYVAGLDVRKRGPMDVQSDVSLRGGTFEQTLILIDGVKMTDPQTGHHNMNLPISKDQIERIEILQGGGSRIFGPNAFSGAINIITKKATKTGGSLDLVGGSFGFMGAGASAEIKGTAHQTLIAVRHDQSDGFRDNTDFQQSVFYLNSRLHLSSSFTTDLQLGYNQKAFGAQNFYSNTYPNQFEATRTQLASVKLSSKTRNNWTVLLYSRQHFDRFELFREGQGFYVFENGFFTRGGDTAAYAPGLFYPGHNYHRTRVYGADFNYSRQNVVGRFALGGEYRYEGIVSNNLGEPLDDVISVRQSRGQYNLGDRRNNLSFFLEQNYSARNWDASLGALVNYNSAFGWDWLPGLDVGYSLLANQKLFGSINRSFRLPSYTDLYYRLGGAQGSLDLQPEYSLNYELGWRYAKQMVSLEATVFRREGQQLIDWVVLPEDALGVLQAKNITAVNTNGFQLNSQLKLRSATFSKMQLNYQYLFVDESDFAFQSLYVLDFLTHKIVGNVAGELPFFALNYTIQLNYQVRRGDYISAITGSPLPFPTVILLDAKLSKSFFSKRMEVYLEGSNLLNREYLDRGNIWLPGRWLRAGLSFQL